MRNLKIFTHSILLITTPSFLVYPQDNQPRVTIQAQKVNFETKDECTQSESNQLLSYDEIMNLLDELESGELENRCDAEELDRINQFLAFLAKEGALPDDSEYCLALEDDIAELLNEGNNLYEYAFSLGIEGNYIFAPAIFNDPGEMVLCKNWVQKSWKKTKKFVKKHKKEIIIGAVVVVTAVVVIAVVAASAGTAAAAAGAAGAAASSRSKKEEKNKSASREPSVSSAPTDAPLLKAVIDEQIVSFKETIVKEHFFETSDYSIQYEELSWEENGRALGSLFAHESLKNLNNQLSENFKLSQEIESIGLQNHFPILREGGGTPLDIGHQEIDRKFSTDYSPLYAISGKEADFNTLSYQIRGEKALAYGYLNQAVNDLGKAIELDPTSPLPYLERGVAYFGLGEYDRSLEDYHQYNSKQTYSLSIPDFSLGFAKGLPKGIYESGEGLLLLLSDLVIHPVHTGEQMWSALTLLSELARSEQWSSLSEVLAPEIHKLVTEWDALPSDVRGELAGYAFGKYGADIIIPGALAKVVSKGLIGAKEISAVYKGLQTAEKTLLLESVAQLENGGKIRGVIQARSMARAEELGFTAREIAQLKNLGKIEGHINSIPKNLPNASRNINFTEHALQRAIERGVSREAIFDALNAPLKIEAIKLDQFGRPSQRFIGKKAEVVLNPETQQIVSINPTSTKKAEKLINELSNASN